MSLSPAEVTFFNAIASAGIRGRHLAALRMMRADLVPLSRVWFLIDYATRSALVAGALSGEAPDCFELHPGVPFENLRHDVQAWIVRYLAGPRVPGCVKSA